MQMSHALKKCVHLNTEGNMRFNFDLFVGQKIIQSFKCLNSSKALVILPCFPTLEVRDYESQRVIKKSTRYIHK